MDLNDNSAVSSDATIASAVQAEAAVVGDAQLACIEQSAGLLAVGTRHQRNMKAVRHLRQILEIPLRYGERDRDRLDLIDDDDARAAR